VPAWLARTLVSIAAATFHIYLFHGFAPKILADLLDRPLPPGLSPVLAIVGGVGLGILVYRVQRALGRVAAAHLPHLRIMSRGQRQMSGA
jgi:hypothetical protein